MDARRFEVCMLFPMSCRILYKTILVLSEQDVMACTHLGSRRTSVRRTRSLQLSVLRNQKYKGRPFSFLILYNFTMSGRSRSTSFKSVAGGLGPQLAATQATRQGPSPWPSQPASISALRRTASHRIVVLDVALGQFVMAAEQWVRLQ